MPSAVVHAAAGRPEGMAGCQQLRNRPAPHGWQCLLRVICWESLTSHSRTREPGEAALRSTFRICGWPHKTLGQQRIENGLLVQQPKAGQRRQGCAG